MHRGQEDADTLEMKVNMAYGPLDITKLDN